MPTIESPSERAVEARLAPPHLFRSFWSGGFESATHVNTRGDRLDMIAGVQHDIRAREDYELLRSAGMKTARDALRWHLIDKGAGDYDFSSFEPMLEASLKSGVQVIWDLCHYGIPDGVNLLKPEFVDRFARFAAAAARFVRERTDEIPFYSPINEINFFAWAAARDIIYPFAFGRDDDIKTQLVRATIAAVEAIRQVDPRARVTYPEPVIYVLPPRNRPDLAKSARDYTESQYDAWDMIAGRSHPELGGRAEYLDIVGVNFYHSNQWEIGGNGRLRWEDHPRDERWMPFSEMLRSVWLRYERPLYVAETSHFGIGRGPWVREMAEEVLKARENSVPVEGICLYPILDRYDWQDKNHWHNSGLWDLATDGAGGYRRVLNADYAAALKDSRELLAAAGCV